ncbi:hypothetical protein HN51_036122, partial [Arachis hypogaea]
FSFSPMQAFNVRRAQVLQWVRLHRFLFSTGIVGYFLTYWTLILYLLVNYMVNHDFHARISSSQGSNLFGNHQPLTIREEFRSAFGQCENTVEAVERMDECSG